MKFNVFSVCRQRVSVSGALSLALVLWWTAAATAQAPPPGTTKAQPPAPAAPSETEAEDLEAEESAAPAATATTGREATELEERYEDPRAQAAMSGDFPQLFGNARPIIATEQRRFDAMASGQTAVDAALLNNYVRYQLSQLTRPENLKSMASPLVDSRGAEAIETAGTNLRQPLETSQTPGFRSAYSQALVSVADDVLKSHLYARTLYMVALSRSRDAAALPVFERVLNDPEQPVSLKLLASVGLTELAQGGRTDIPPQQALPAARALAGFLERERDTFWPARFRALQALGALRQAASDPLRPEADLAATALSFLADPDEVAPVRTWAGWALSLLRPSATNHAQYNFLLIAHHLGLAVADLGDRIVATQADNPEQATRLTSLLLQLYLSFVGESDILNSGLLRVDHPNARAQRGQIQPIADRVRAVVAAAVDLSRAPPQQWTQFREDLAARVQDLRSHLASAPPASPALFPNGPEFPVTQAGGAGPQARAAGPGPGTGPRY